ncbi:helix-turn-helix domain-containing protein [Sphingomonas adhaesiva]|uniref:helix-turn-helix domain-containing protein n=1 Tax=Sphingomonas adhaesiva TaxID=28212 RepID=UPI002FF914C1
MEDLFLELLERLQLAGCTSDASCPLPLTQEILADALGLTSVHLNRVLQSARRENRLTLRNGVLELLDPERSRHQVRRVARR